MNAISTISKSNIDAVLKKIRSLSEQIEKPNHYDRVNKTPTSKFENIINQVKKQIHQVNDVQNQANTLQAAYLKGDSDVSLAQVLASSAQSKVAFEGLIAVRKHFIETYKEIMSMPL